MIARLHAIVAWLRAGYPHGIPEQDYIPLIALLSRRLSDEETRELGEELVADGLVPSDRVDLSTGYLKKVGELPREAEVQRVAALLYQAGWDVSGLLDAEETDLPDRDELLASVRSDLPTAAEALLARYDEPHRAYHNRTHLSESWDALRRVLSAEGVGGPEARAARLALWFHDCVYDPRADDNEALSALIARAELLRAGEPATFVERVAQLVEATAEHIGAPGDLAAACLMDADLWILSAPPPRYREYVRQVRREYAHVSRDDFVAGRQAVLRHLLGRGPIYTTPAAGRWEGAALANMARELADYAVYHSDR